MGNQSSKKVLFRFLSLKKLTNSVFNFRILNEKTPRSFTFLLAGCLPAEAMIHNKQLSLFMMMRNDPLNHHARYVYNSVKCPSKSWFSQILSLCTMYGLEHPLELLESPPKKKSLKEAVNTKVLHYTGNQNSEMKHQPFNPYFIFPPLKAV